MAVTEVDSAPADRGPHLDTLTRVIADALARLYRAAEDGRLAELCHRLDVVLVTVFGSAARDPTTARDLDVAVLFGRRTRTAPLELVNELVTITGTEDVDLMVLDGADPIARFDATAGALPIYQDAPMRWGDTQMAYAGEVYDTELMRRAELERMARR